MLSYFYTMDQGMEYEAVIGLEVHAQLLTKSKLFCADSTEFGAGPNTNVSPISLAHPGTLPVTNKKAVELAIKLGIALHCEIERHSYFARKNYFYPDLPKGYQVSQHTTPICKGGAVNIRVGSEEKSVILDHIHLEEDAGKSIHDADENYTSIDLNRAGVPLLEIVTGPNMHSPDEVYAFLTEIRRLVRYLDVCNGNMEEGSLRCDANVSVRLRGDKKLGTKVEIKNLNSISNAKKAVEYEIGRLTGLHKNNEPLLQETRSFNAETGSTSSLRTKEEANDYRYFAEPDLAPLYITDEMIAAVRRSIPSLPQEIEKKYREEFFLSSYDAGLLSEDKATSDLFDAVTEYSKNYKATANWLLGPVRAYLNEAGIEPGQLPVSPKTIADLIKLVEDGSINFTAASSRVFPLLLQQPGMSPLQLATQLNLLQESDEDAVALWVDQAIAEMPEKVTEYKKGKKTLIGLFAGEVKRLSKGKADMQLVNKLLREKLNQ